MTTSVSQLQTTHGEDEPSQACEEVGPELSKSTGLSDMQLSAREAYAEHLETLRDIIANDHFDSDMPPKIVEGWVQVLDPGNPIPLPQDVKGLYGGSPKASIPILLARGSLKYIMHETADKEKIEKYARRMLISLSTIDVDELGKREPTMAALMLWHKTLALVRLHNCERALVDTLCEYDKLRPKSPLSEKKLPPSSRLVVRLQELAAKVGNSAASEWLAKVKLPKPEIVDS